MYFAKTFLTIAFLLLLLLIAPALANAESRHVATSTTPATTSARLDFQIEIPKVLFLRVGSGADNTDVSNIDLITFQVNAANVGDGSPVAATSASGDLGGGAVTAKVVGNNGIVTFTSSTLGALQNGSGDGISHGQIVATV
ncbi:MAG: hypothetical protein ACREO2_11395, partial [Arenimonas sp.]